MQKYNLFIWILYVWYAENKFCKNNEEFYTLYIFLENFYFTIFGNVNFAIRLALYSL